MVRGEQLSESGQNSTVGEMVASQEALRSKMTLILILRPQGYIAAITRVYELEKN